MLGRYELWNGGPNYELCICDILAKYVQERASSKQATIIFQRDGLLQFINEMSFLQEFKNTDGIPNVSLTIETYKIWGKTRFSS